MAGFLVTPEGRKFPVEDGLVIGRVPECDIVIEDSKSSRRHARLIVAGGVVEIEDLGSSNGTFLNGARITKRVLRAGDTVQIGTTALRFETQAAPEPAAPPLAVPAGHELSFDDEPMDDGPPVRVQRKASPPPEREVEVLEFVDEVVEVLKRESSSPEFATRKPTAPVVRETGRGVLQFASRRESKSLLGDDLAQMSTGMRALLILGALVLAGAVGYLAMRLAQ